MIPAVPQPLSSLSPANTLLQPDQPNSSHLPSLTASTQSAPFSQQSFTFVPSSSTPSVCFSTGAIQQPITSAPLPQRSKKSKPNPSPESVQIEFLKKELTIAQTKISALENDVKRKEETCKIQEERIKSLEHPAVSNLFNQYLPQSQVPSTGTLCSSHPLVEKLLGEVKELRGQVTNLQQLFQGTAGQHVTDDNPGHPDSAQPHYSTIESQESPPHANFVSDHPNETLLKPVQDEVQAQAYVHPGDPGAQADILPAQTSYLPNKKTRARRARRMRGKVTQNPRVRVQPWQSTTVWNNGPNSAQPRIQPWLSSTVWDHGPTLSLSQPSDHSRRVRSSVRHDQRQPSHAPPRRVSPVWQGPKSRQRHRSSSHVAPSRVQQTPHTTSSSFLGGKRNQQSVRDNVRSSWASRYLQPKLPSHHVRERISEPVVDTVRSVWARRFPQAEHSNSPSCINLN